MAGCLDKHRSDQVDESEVGGVHIPMALVSGAKLSFNFELGPWLTHLPYHALYICPCFMCRDTERPGEW